MNEFEAQLEEGVGRLQDGMSGLAGGNGPRVGGVRGLGGVCDTVRDLTADRPLFALLGATIGAFVATMLWRRR
ncbi:hypothetical protein [Novacetimonas pomaceti]|uniref:CsbD family protein n=1 Tax=Novacetimonas pomaceti TaxID=2021998 RepID=A0A318QHZ7_9PROT|nr:hypothetical protein [Novacetimonas pomaceti]MBV1834291.1 hypothetical protein [Novacetimonas pomaceti]PYD47546.1 hypothetical protein C3920_09115 [Novacetimonas pomaceti]PYD76912.1 hypothetical protein CFR71_00695 [Novacetimonas pomaceti]